MFLYHVLYSIKILTHPSGRFFSSVKNIGVLFLEKYQVQIAKVDLTILCVKKILPTIRALSFLKHECLFRLKAQFCSESTDVVLLYPDSRCQDFARARVWSDCYVICYMLYVIWLCYYVISFSLDSLHSDFVQSCLLCITESF